MSARSLKRIIPAVACIGFILLFLFHSYNAAYPTIVDGDNTAWGGPVKPWQEGGGQKEGAFNGVGHSEEEKKPEEKENAVIPAPIPISIPDADTESNPTFLAADIVEPILQSTQPTTSDLSNDNKPILPAPSTHIELTSQTTPSGAYFPISFLHRRGFNPNFIPHPFLPSTWLIIAQALRPPTTTPDSSIWSTEIICPAVFTNHALTCLEPPLILPIAATPNGPHCIGDHAYFGFNIGPHDARIFFGPTAPYAIYGSNSQYTCFGQWIQDFRVLTDWGMDALGADTFHRGTELQRPPPYAFTEKNWFVFWASGDQDVFVHYDMWPRRSFAKLEKDGSVGADLAGYAATAGDEKCMERFMPRVHGDKEKIHQATNSLRVTLCKRADVGCQADSSNTFIMALFQHKTYVAFRSVYEPYLALFRQEAPFKLYAISSKPFWVRGRKGSTRVGEEAEDPIWRDDDELIYISSMAWSQAGLKYHGYADDIIFIGFGIEDKDTAGIDVLAGDLLQDLSLCKDA